MELPALYAAKFLGMGLPELIIILVVVLLIFGPKNLPKLGASLGRTVKSVRDGIEGNELEEGEIADDDDEEEAEEPAPKKKSTSSSSKSKKN